jgi:hypothetical protein
VPDLHVCALQTGGVTDPRPWGCDAAIEVPPHDPASAPLTSGIVDYRTIVVQALHQPPPEYHLYRGAMPSWDDSARKDRKDDRALIAVNGSPLDYLSWLRRVAETTRLTHSAEEQIVFINAWNEWEDGCYLEPDTRYGRAYLETTRIALEPGLGVGEPLERLPATSANGAIADIRAAFEARERSLLALGDALRRKNAQIDELMERLATLSEYESRPLGALAKRQLGRYPRLKTALKRLLGRA